MSDDDKTQVIRIIQIHILPSMANEIQNVARPIKACALKCDNAVRIAIILTKTGSPLQPQ